MNGRHHEVRGHNAVVATKSPQPRDLASGVSRHAGCNSPASVAMGGDIDAEHLLEVLRTEFRRLSQVRANRVSELDARIGSLEQDLRATEELLLAAERQAARLASLYAAAYQLHSLDPSEITAALGEITGDLLGARRAQLLMSSTDRPGTYDVVELVSASPAASVPPYRGGDALIDSCLATGEMQLATALPASTLAAVPLTLQGDVVGALVVLELLPQKPALQTEDHDLLDLLAAHAASALVGARVFQDTQRKLRTLEGLVSLLRRTPGGAA